MMKRSLIVLAVVLFVLAGSACYASWTNSLLRAVDPNNPPNLLPESLLVSPSYSPIIGGYTYTYVLTNNTPQEHIVGFTMTFPMAVPVTAYTLIQVPAGWDAFLTKTATVNKINWKWNGADDAQSLLPGDSKTFGFNAAWGPSNTMNVFASSQDSFGFSGKTFGPVVPEPASIVAMLSGLFGLAGLKLRKRI